MLALLRMEDVDDHVVEIDHDPATHREPVMMLRPHPGITAATRDLIGDRLEVWFGVPGTDEKIIGDRRCLANVEDHHIVALLIEGCIPAKFG